jgi:hypothetical protein
MLPTIAGDPEFIRFAVAEHPERRGQFGIIMVDERNGVSPVGRDDFPSASAALTAFRMFLAKGVGLRKD